MPDNVFDSSAPQHNWVTHWPYPCLIIDDRQRIIFLSLDAQKLLGFDDNGYLMQEAHTLLCSIDRGHAHSPETCFFNSDWREPRSLTWCHQEGYYVSVDAQVIVNAHLAHRGRFVSFQNNSDRSYNHEELRRFAHYVEGSPTPMAELDRCGQLLFANAVFQGMMLEYGFDEQGRAQVLPAAIEGICEQLFEREKSSHTEQVSHQGRFFQWEFQRIVSDPGLGLYHDSVLVFGKDISETKALEEKIATAKAEARRDFISKMVHELRTPLNSIVGFTNLLLKRSAARLSDQELQQLRRIKNAGHQLGELITDTLDFSKIEAGHMTVSVDQFDARDLVKSIYGQMESLAITKSLNYFCNLPESPLLMQSDPGKFRQIAVNLISNALKYTQEGSVKVDLEDHGKEICLRIVDTGKGIDATQKEHLFTAYNRLGEEASSAIEGTGLGLALVKELLTLLNGRIDVASELGAGSTFSVFIPCILTCEMRSD